MIAFCVGCWCTDEMACVDPATQLPCHWLRVDRRSGFGVCSCCKAQLEAWDGGGWEWLANWAIAPEVGGQAGIPNSSAGLVAADHRAQPA